MGFRGIFTPLGQKPKGLTLSYLIPDIGSDGTNPISESNPYTVVYPAAYVVNRVWHTSITIDWGDGNVETITGPVTDKQHSYTESGEKKIKITSSNGDVYFYRFYQKTGTNSVMKGIVYANVKFYSTTNSTRVAETTSFASGFRGCTEFKYSIPNSLFQNNRDVTSLSYCFGSILHHTTIPPHLYSNFTKLVAMDCVFYSSTNNIDLTGEIPPIPSTVTNMQNAFYQCVKLTGNIPDLPPRLTNIYGTFFMCGLTGEIPELPSTLTGSLDSTFRELKVTGSIPELPSGITSLRYAFYNCKNLTGSIPTLPPNLTSLELAFYGCSGLTGQLPAIPSSVTNMNGVFFNCTGITSNLPNIPTTITNVSEMVYSCRISGSIPQGYFDGCTNLTNPQHAFRGANGLSGQIPRDLFKDVPNTITRIDMMFSGCGSNLTGHIQADMFDRFSALTAVYQVFENCPNLEPDTVAPYIPQFWDITKFPKVAATGSAAYKNASPSISALAPANYGGTIANWAKSKAYAVGDRTFVPNNHKIYTCQTAHTSGATFDASKWVEGYDLPN